jgi:hypothetical protein
MNTAALSIVATLLACIVILVAPRDQSSDGGQPSASRGRENREHARRRDESRPPLASEDTQALLIAGRLASTSYRLPGEHSAMQTWSVLSSGDCAVPGSGGESIQARDGDLNRMRESLSRRRTELGPDQRVTFGEEQEFVGFEPLRIGNADEPWALAPSEPRSPEAAARLVDKHGSSRDPAPVEADPKAE